MFLKRLFDIVASLCGLLIIWPLIIVVAILVKVKMPGGPAFFCQKRVGKDGKLFTFFATSAGLDCGGETCDKCFCDAGVVGWHCSVRFG